MCILYIVVQINTALSAVLRLSKALYHVRGAKSFNTENFLQKRKGEVMGRLKNEERKEAYKTIKGMCNGTVISFQDAQRADYLWSVLTFDAFKRIHNDLQHVANIPIHELLTQDSGERSEPTTQEILEHCNSELLEILLNDARTAERAAQSLQSAIGAELSKSRREAAGPD